MAAKATEQENKAAKILVAEDNPAVREFVVRALASLPCAITAAADGQEALDHLAKAEYDVLVTDIVMPNVDGIALAMKAIRLYPELRVVMISGYAQERMRAHNLEALVARIVAKPFSLEEICDAVRSAIAKEALPPT